MRCAVLAVGTELLLGQIANTNAAWIGAELAAAGIDCHQQMVVGDNAGRIVAALRQLLAGSDAVIVSGGLGPTQDDLTREAIAALLGVGLERDEAIVERLRHRFASRGMSMPENNLRQADVPHGATVIPQQPGTAPGLACPVGDTGKTVYAVPGVPWEMQTMVGEFVVPDLRRQAGQSDVIRSRVLRTWGHSESRLAEMLAEYVADLDERGTATLAFLASGAAGIRVRLTVKAGSDAQAEAALEPEVATVSEILGPSVFSTQDRSVEEELLLLLRAAGLTLATAESVTGGLIAARVTAVPGASEVFRGSVVGYASDVKHSLLGVPPGPVVTEDAALAMAAGARRTLGADCAVATTGVAGPDTQEGRPVGTVCLAWSTPAAAGSRTVRLPGDRARVREYAATSALDLLRRELTATDRTHAD